MYTITSPTQILLLNTESLCFASVHFLLSRLLRHPTPDPIAQWLLLFVLVDALFHVLNHLIETSDLGINLLLLLELFTLFLNLLLNLKIFISSLSIRCYYN